MLATRKKRNLRNTFIFLNEYTLNSSNFFNSFKTIKFLLSLSNCNVSCKTFSIPSNTQLTIDGPMADPLGIPFLGIHLIEFVDSAKNKP